MTTRVGIKSGRPDAVFTFNKHPSLFVALSFIADPSLVYLQDRLQTQKEERNAHEIGPPEGENILFRTEI